MAKRRTASRSTSKLLAELEEVIGAELPSEYREFMAGFDRKLPQQRSFKVRRDDWRELNELWPLKGRYQSLAGGWGLLKGKEARLLVIGDDGSGNWFCLAVKGADRGKVFFVDHEYSPGERQRVVSLADTFGAFMARLTEPAA